MGKVANLQESMIELLENDINKILTLIEAQTKYLTKQQYPLYEDLLDTQMFGFSQVVDFLIRLGLLNHTEGKAITMGLEIRLNQMYETIKNNSDQ